MTDQNPSHPQYAIGVAGAGYFAQLHHKAWQRCTTAQLVAVADTRSDAQVPDGVPLLASVQQMLEQFTIDVLDIVTPPHTHRLMIQTALEYGVKKIICQKPFCTSFAEAEEMVVRAEQAGASLVIHENFRFQPWYRYLKEALQKHRFGEIYQFEFALRPGDGRGDDAYLERQPYFQQMPRFLIQETAVHFLDVFCFLFGRPTALYADIRKLNPVIAGEDAAQIILNFGSRMRAVFDGNRLSDHLSAQPRLTMGEAVMSCEAGTVSLYGDGSLHLRPHLSDQSEILLPAYSPGAGGDIFGGDCVYHLCQHALNAWLNGQNPENTAREYLEILRLVEISYQSAEKAKRITIEYS